jgi:hypothetical protein
MPNYKSGRINGFWRIMKQWLIGVLVLTLFPLLAYVAPDLFPFKNTNWVFLLIFFSISHFATISRFNWVNEVIIDPDQRSLLVKYYNLYEGIASEVFHFDNLRIRINKGRLFNRSNISSVSILKGKKEEYEISKQKDGYSRASVKELAALLESLTHPVPK